MILKVQINDRCTNSDLATVYYTINFNIFIVVLFSQKDKMYKDLQILYFCIEELR